MVGTHHESGNEPEVRRHLVTDRTPYTVPEPVVDPYESVQRVDKKSGNSNQIQQECDTA